jgi:hypothetical protein
MAGITEEQPRFECVFCAGEVGSGDASLCSLRLTTHWGETRPKQREQQFFCHAACFRQAVHPGIPLYAFDLDGV